MVGEKLGIDYEDYEMARTRRVGDSAAGAALLDLKIENFRTRHNI